jgi:hypothetical protein
VGTGIVTNPVYTYLIIHPPGCAHAGYRRSGKLYTRHTSFKDVISHVREYNLDCPGHRFQKTRPRHRGEILRGLLADRELGHLCVWYRHHHPAGWMINEEHDPDGQHGMQRLGFSFREAVDMIQSGTLDRMFERILDGR